MNKYILTLIWYTLTLIWYTFDLDLVYLDLDMLYFDLDLVYRDLDKVYLPLNMVYVNLNLVYLDLEVYLNLGMVYLDLDMVYLELGIVCLDLEIIYFDLELVHDSLNYTLTRSQYYDCCRMTSKNGGIVSVPGHNIFYYRLGILWLWTMYILSEVYFRRLEVRDVIWLVYRRGHQALSFRGLNLLPIERPQSH